MNFLDFFRYLSFIIICACIYIALLAILSGCTTAPQNPPNIEGSYKASSPMQGIESIDLSLFNGQYLMVWNSPPQHIQISGTYTQSMENICFYISDCETSQGNDCTSDVFDLNSDPCGRYEFTPNRLRFLDSDAGWISFRPK